MKCKCMKTIRIYLLIVITQVLPLHSNAQRLTLTEMANFCSKKNWEDVNQALLNKNWTYYDSEKGSTYNYNTITWSYNKENYNDKAQGWLYLFTYEGMPNKILYVVFNKDSYSLIQNSISSADFKLVDSAIEDNEVVSTYANSSYSLTIAIERRKDSDYSNKSTTAYRITLVKKAGVYDTENGKKTEYYYDDVVKTEYTLLNGKLNGKLMTYHSNGKLEKMGNYVNGVENGLFKKYDDSGNLEAEYTMSNGELNGPLKTYYYNAQLKKSGTYLKGKENGNFVEYNENGNKEVEYTMTNGLENGVVKTYVNNKIDTYTTMKGGIKSGQYIEYYYDEENGKLKFKLIGEYLNEEKQGDWKLFYIDDEYKEKLLKYESYVKDIKNGQFQDFKGDSLFLGSYKDDQLHGDYRIYLDVSRLLLGGYLKTDTSMLTLITKGNYVNGMKSGHWKFYDYTGTLVKEGAFSNDNRIGEWKYYYTNWSDDKGIDQRYAKELYLVSNYTNGLLDGKSTRYSYLEKKKVLCSETNKDANPLDTCHSLEYKKVNEISYFKNGKLNGPYELRDSSNEIDTKGFYKDDMRFGEWLYRYDDINLYEDVFYIKGNYSNNKKDGKWIRYVNEGNILETFNYKNDELDGEYISWNRFNKPRERKQFRNGKLFEFINYDSLGIKPINKYEIYDDVVSSLKCRKTGYFEDSIVSQEYFIKKVGEIDHDWFEFDVDSVLSEEAKCYKDGEFKVIDSGNQTIISGKYLKEDKIGLWTYYYYDQNVKIESNFIQGIKVDEKYLNLNGELFSGTFKFIDNENGISEERKIKNGLRNGKTTYIDSKTNKKIKKENYKEGKLD